MCGLPVTLEDGPRLDPRRGLQHGEPLRRHGDRREPLADAFDEGIAAADEERHVGAEPERERLQPLARPVEAPQPVQRQQGARRVAAAAAQAGAGGQPLVDRDVGAEARAARRLQRPRRAQAQVVLGQRSAEIVAREPRVGAAFEVQACRTSRSARTATAAGGSRRRGGRRRAGTGSAWPAPARRSTMTGSDGPSPAEYRGRSPGASAASSRPARLGTPNDRRVSRDLRGRPGAGLIARAAPAP